MDMNDQCPFCNNSTKLQNPSFSDQFHTDGVDNSDIVTPDGTVGFPEESDPNSFYKCDNCPIDYVKESMGIDEIVKNLDDNRNTAMLLNHYYGDTPFLELFTKENIRLFRKPPHAYSFVSKAKAEKQIFFVLTYNNKKTSGIILKTGRKSYKLSDLEEI